VTEEHDIKAEERQESGAERRKLLGRVAGQHESRPERWKDR